MLPAEIELPLLKTLESAGDHIGELKSYIDAINQALLAAFKKGASIDSVITGRAHLVDKLLQSIWEQKCDPDCGAALIAVGGYGRGELHPSSDIDLLFLVEESLQQESEEQISAIVTLLWDIGLNIGHSVRTPEMCATEAENDITVTTTLMESRLLAGSESLYTEMQAATGPDKVWPPDAFFQAKLEEQQRRHKKYDDTAHNLEPNIKGGPGGLRDIQMIQWVARRKFGVTSLNELVERGILTEAEFRSLELGKKHLWRIRFMLHTITEREEDRLLFDLQQKLAAAFEHRDNEANLAVEQFMQKYYRTIARLQRLNEILLQYFEESILNADEKREITVLNRRFHIVNGYIGAVDSQIFSHRPLALLEIFFLITQNPMIRGIRASTIRLIHEHLHLIDRRFRNDPKAKQLFLQIVRQSHGVYRVLRSMNRYGLLAAYIPAFTNIVGRMQYDLFHVYTVDTHTLFLIRNMRRLTVPELSSEFPLASEIMASIDQQETLILAALFHDIAKGRGGDHSELGAVDALHFCRAHNLSEQQVHLISWLVKNHLVMSMTAQRKDIEDPDVIRNFAKLVMTPKHLKHLYLLTLCDMRATNPKRWNGWKDTLLKQLYRHTLRELNNPQSEADDYSELQKKQTQAREELADQDQKAVTQLWMQFSTDYFQHHSVQEIAWHADVILSTPEHEYPQVRIQCEMKPGASEILIVDIDHDNLFAIITSIIDQCALNIVQARCETTDDNKAINSFSVLEEDGSLICDRHREEEIRSRLIDDIKNLTEPPVNSRHVPRQLKHFEIPTTIEFSQDKTNMRTLLRLQTADRHGLLSRVGLALSQAEVRLLNVIIATVGAKAEDTFFLVDRNDEPITDPEHLERIKSTLLEHLE
ncbi:[protein-PII] uridylyltransferase [Solemya velum gill symbiont]|uniref:[protein-PII] uridylyltransferase n=1 Tax=Solemya velum gill symbiont TaxID=2340 RepID=UPI000995FD1E|nr:[protein-PII] uridylyltransferase [Solemya velum gill symbiont]OOZ18691.1 [protein-PII] uridylyltransferase [Solemya velum gill symbiont]OOZ28192.1 [protein-PII] uridylyltransferase [Solemya velum gill symbiont]